MRSARACHAASPVASPAARNASTRCMFAFAPRYGSEVVQARSQDSRHAPSSSDQKRCSTTRAAWSRSGAAGSRPAIAPLAAASSTNECG